MGKVVRQLFILLSAMFMLSSSAMAWMLEAEGFGDTPEKSKLAAYATLAGQIRSEIKSETNISIQLSNQQVTKNDSMTQSQKSDLLLKGVNYQEVSKFQDGYRTVATFDAAALRQTLSYYEMQTVFDPFGITVTRAHELKDILLMWHSLQLLCADKVCEADYRRTLDQRTRLVNARLESGLLRVHSNAPHAEIEIDGHVSQLDEPLILEVGNHQYTLAAPKFKPLTKVVYIEKGSALSLAEDLVPLTNEVRKLALSVGAELLDYVPQAQLKTIMDEMGWEIAANSTLQLRIEGTSSVRQSGAFAQYDFDFNIGVFDRNRRLKTVTFKKGYTFNLGTTNQQVAQSIMPEIRKAVLLLANNVVWPGK
jgi:hypothetical protein